MLTRRFTLGGTLSIVNCFFWVCIVAGVRELPEWAVTALMPLMVFLALPIGVLCLLPTHTGGPLEFEIVLTAVGFGINGLLWGHGLAWIIRSVGRRFDWIRPEQPPRVNEPPARRPAQHAQESAD
ncbi:MAG: hypothetical protein WBC44_01565 [Planctomycetaceae bacterium]